MEKMKPRRGSIAAIDEFASAPPGHSLTEDNTRWPWGKPPQEANPDRALAASIRSLEKPRIQQELIKLLMVGVSVEVIVEGILMQGFTEGKFNPDIGLLMKRPLALFIADMAEEAGIPYRFFENNNALEEGTMDDETFISMMQKNNPAMFDMLYENVNAAIRAGKKPREDNFMNMKKED